MQPILTPTKIALLVAAVFFLCLPGARAAGETVEALLKQAQAAFEKGETVTAASLASRAVAADPENPHAYFSRARIREESGLLAGAVADYDRAVKLDPRLADAFRYRGLTQFRLGNVDASVADFDQFLALSPRQAPFLWQRGIACYYAGRYEAGRKQLELHQVVNPDDVENAAWHFFCNVRLVGMAKARDALLPVQEDRRVPMMQIYALLEGKGTPETVLAAAQAGQPSPGDLNQRLFYAHLYLGLYYEASGDAKLAREHIDKAATGFNVGHYMGDVARVHAALLRKGAEKKQSRP